MTNTVSLARNLWGHRVRLVPSLGRLPDAGHGFANAGGGPERRIAVRRRARRTGQQLGRGLGHRQYAGGPLAVAVGPLRAAGVVLRVGPNPRHEVRYAQCLASGFGQTAGHRQVRDLARFQRLRFAILNRTGVPLGGMLQIKDYRDSLAQRAVYRFAVPAGERWTEIDLRLNPSEAGWEVDGQPDLTQVLTIDFGFEPAVGPDGGMRVPRRSDLDGTGRAPGRGHAPAGAAGRTLGAAAMGRALGRASRSSGLIPNNSYQSSDAGLNTTSAVLWMLPAAVDHALGFARASRRLRAAAGATFQGLLDRSSHLPPRNVDWVTLEPSLLPEESSVDAAFLALALHQYQSLRTTSAELRQAIERVQDRLDFAAFACPAGWRMAYRYATRSHPAGFVQGTYDGYTNEANIISLAAHLAGRERDPHRNLLEQQHPSPADAFGRPGAFAGRPRGKGVSAAFAQALLNLFVDVRQRGHRHLSGRWVGHQSVAKLRALRAVGDGAVGDAGPFRAGAAGCGRRWHVGQLPAVQPVRRFRSERLVHALERGLSAAGRGTGRRGGPAIPAAARAPWPVGVRRCGPLEDGPGGALAGYRAA